MFLIGSFQVMAQDKTKSKTVKPAVQQEQVIDLNTASQAQLETLPRIGPAIALRIISFREEHKGFKKVEEILNVKGIGSKTFEKIKHLIKV